MPFDPGINSPIPNLSLARLATLTESECEDVIRRARWPDTSGDPYCSGCGSLRILRLEKARRFHCRDCQRQFTTTTQTALASGHMYAKEILWNVVLFTSQAKGIAALSVSNILEQNYKTVFLFHHKIREGMYRRQLALPPLLGDIEVDGAFFGGYFQTYNKSTKTGKHVARRRYGERRVMMVAIARDGSGIRTLACQGEAEAAPWINHVCGPSSRVFTDCAKSFDWLSARKDVEHLRVNHSIEWQNGEAKTNLCETFFSVARRKQMGVHHKMSGAYLGGYAAEIAWRQEHRKLRINEKAWEVLKLLLAIGSPSSMRGYPFSLWDHSQVAESAGSAMVKIETEAPWIERAPSAAPQTKCWWLRALESGGDIA